MGVTQRASGSQKIPALFLSMTANGQPCWSTDHLHVVLLQQCPAAGPQTPDLQMRPNLSAPFFLTSVMSMISSNSVCLHPCQPAHDTCSTIVHPCWKSTLLHAIPILHTLPHLIVAQLS